MKFNSQICTTREQSERLLALGLKKESADMSITTMPVDGVYKGVKYSLTPYSEIRYPSVFGVIPAWSLHRLIEIAELPQYWECISGNWYEEVIAHIQSMIHINEFNKEYLE